MADEPIEPTPPAGDPPPPAGFSREYVQGLRAESAKYRTQYQAEKSSREQHEMRATEREAEVSSLKVQLGLSDVLHKRGLKPALTRAMLHTENLLADLDPGAEDFADTLDSRVTELASRNPELRENAHPMRSAAEFNGPGQVERLQLTRADAQNMTAEQIMAAKAAGRFDWLLGSRS